MCRWGFPTSTKSSFFQAWGIFQYLCLKRPKNTCCAKTATLSLSRQLLKQHSLKCWETKFLTFPESLRTCVALVKHIPIRVPIQHHWNKKKIKKDLSYYMTKYLRYECIMNCTMNPHFAMTSVGIRIVWQGDKVSPKNNSFCDSQSYFRKFFKSQWESSNQWLFLLSQTAKISSPLDQGGPWLNAGAFRMFVPFFRNSFFPLLKCGTLQYFWLKDPKNIDPFLQFCGCSSHSLIFHNTWLGDM